VWGVNGGFCAALVGLLMLTAARVPAKQPEILFSAPTGIRTDSPRVAAQGNQICAAGETFAPEAGTNRLRTTSTVTCFDTQGRTLWVYQFPRADYSRIRTLEVDVQGNLYIAGTTSGTDFPVTLDALPVTLPATENGSFEHSPAFLAELSPHGRLLYCTYLSGPGGAEITDLTLTPSGDIIVAGATTDPEFPTTPGAIIETFEQYTAFGFSSYAFITRFRPGERTLEFSTLLGGRTAACSCGGSCCIGVVGQTQPTAVTTDGQGNAYVAGFTSATDFPVTDGFVDSFPTPFKAREFDFAAKLSPDGTRLIYSVYTGAAPAPGAIAVNASGALIAAGSTLNTLFAVTEDAAQPKHEACESSRYCTVPNSFIYRLKRDGSGFEYASYVGGHSAGISALAVDPGGALWVAGTGTGADFPSSGNDFSRGEDFLLELAPDAREVLASYRFPRGIGGGGLMLAGPGRLALAGLRDTTAPAIHGVASSAGYWIEGTVSPGELVSLYGYDIGPAHPAGLKLGPEGVVSNNLEGVRVFFQGLSAPLTYAQNDQINAVVPFGIAGIPRIHIELMKNNQVVASLDALVRPTKPRFYPNPIDDMGNAAINEDGTINSHEHPASPGSIVALYGTGFGDLVPRPADGALIQEPYPELAALVSASLETGEPLEVLYAGPAPGLVAGVVQINIRLPGTTGGPWRVIRIQTGNESTYASVW